MVPPPPSRDAHDALLAVERLHLRHKLLSLEEAKRAARLIAGEEVEFPLPRPPREEAPPPPQPQASQPPPRQEAPPAEPSPSEGDVPKAETGEPAGEPGAEPGATPPPS